MITLDLVSERYHLLLFLIFFHHGLFHLLNDNLYLICYASSRWVSNPINSLSIFSIYLLQTYSFKLSLLEDSHSTISYWPRFTCGFIDGTNKCLPPTIKLGGTEVANLAQKMRIKQDQILVSFLLSSISPDLLHLVVSCDTTKAINLGQAKGGASLSISHLCFGTAYPVI